jgi:hypothetical protein
MNTIQIRGQSLASAESKKSRNLAFGGCASLGITLLGLFLFQSAAHSQEAQKGDNRIKPGFKVGDTIPESNELLDESNLFDKIASFQNDDLTKALGRDIPAKSEFRSLRLKWQKRIALRDADYILCLFDSTAHVEPGDNPRVLILFNLGYRLKTWGQFTCAPFFAFGSILNPISKPETYFVTVNPSGRFGGELWFEKYLISADKITKLGGGCEVTKIPNH